MEVSEIDKEEYDIIDMDDNLLQLLEEQSKPYQVVAGNISDGNICESLTRSVCMSTTETQIEGLSVSDTPQLNEQIFLTPPRSAIVTKKHELTPMSKAQSEPPAKRHNVSFTPPSKTPNVLLGHQKRERRKIILLMLTDNFMYENGSKIAIDALKNILMKQCPSEKRHLLYGNLGTKIGTMTVREFDPRVTYNKYSKEFTGLSIKGQLPPISDGMHAGYEEEMNLNATTTPHLVSDQNSKDANSSTPPNRANDGTPSADIGEGHVQTRLTNLIDLLGKHQKSASSILHLSYKACISLEESELINELERIEKERGVIIDSIIDIYSSEVDRLSKSELTSKLNRAQQNTIMMELNKLSTSFNLELSIYKKRDIPYDLLETITNKIEKDCPFLHNIINTMIIDESTIGCNKIETPAKKHKRAIQHLSSLLQICSKFSENDLSLLFGLVCISYGAGQKFITFLNKLGLSKSWEVLLGFMEERLKSSLKSSPSLFRQQNLLCTLLLI